MSKSGFSAVAPLVPVTPEAKALVESFFPALCRNLDLVEEDPRLFRARLPNSFCAFAFGGVLDVPLGIWARAWRQGKGTADCGACGGPAYFVFSNGAMSGGWSSGYCSRCGKPWSGRKWSPGVWAFLRQELEASGGADADLPAYSLEEVARLLEAR